MIAKATVKNGNWTLLAGSILAIKEDAGGGRGAKALRNTLPVDESGKLLEDVELGNQAPSYVGVVVMNQAIDGWLEWKNKDGKPIDIYRKSKGDE